MSPASEIFRQGATLDDPLPPADPSSTGELPITPALKSAFLSSLEAYGVTFNFFSGSWKTFDLQLAGGQYDLIMTSETIYRPESLPSLIQLMQCASGIAIADPSLEALTSKRLSLAVPRRTICMVAAKVLYFGVGGGVSDFVRIVEEEKKGRVETVWEKKIGVGRKVMCVEWAGDKP